MKKLTLDNFKCIINSINTFLCDCYGVLWSGSTLIKNTDTVVKQLKTLGKEFYYVTNNSSNSREAYIKKCEKLGFPAKKEEIICTSFVAAEYLKRLHFKKKIYLLGSKLMAEELKNAGLSCSGVGPDPMPDDVEHSTLGRNFKVDPEIGCVLVGFDKHFSYVKAMKACAYLKNPECLFVATNTDNILPLEGGNSVPGTGPFIRLIEEASGRRATFVGKPERTMISHLQSSIIPHQTLMIGDRLDTDIRFAKNCGLKSLLVLTGFQSLEHAEELASSNELEKRQLAPDYYIDSLGDLAQMLAQVSL